MKCENFPPLWTWQKQNKDKLQVIFYYSGEETKPSYDLSLCIRVVAIFPSYYRKETNKQTSRDAHEPEDEVGKPQSSVPGLTTSHAPFPGTKPLLRTQLVLFSGGAAASPLPQGVEPGPPGLSRREALVTGLFSVPEPQGEKRNQQSELPRFLSFGSKIITKYTIKNLNGFSWYFLSRESM